MMQHLEDADLAGDSLDICLVRDLLFLQCLDCYFLVGGPMNPQFDFAEGALADDATLMAKIVPT